MFALSPAQNFEMIRGIVRTEDSLNEALQQRLQTQDVFDAGDSTQQQQDREVRCIFIYGNNVGRMSCILVLRAINLFMEEEVRL